MKGEKKMSETTLQCSLTIRAEETTLQNIHNLLVSQEDERPPLSEELAKIAKQTLIAAGIKDEFKIELQHSRMTTSYHRSGGLNPDEWLERQRPSDQPASRIEGQEAGPDTID